MRVNGLSTPWGADDVAAIARAARRTRWCCPRSSPPRRCTPPARALAAAGAPARLALWCMIETPRGVLAVAEIAAASPRVSCLVAGTSDLVKDLRARHTPGRAEVLTSLALIVLAARAGGLAALDGVHLDLADDAGFEASLPPGPRPRLRREDAHPPEDDRRGEPRRSPRTRPSSTRRGG